MSYHNIFSINFNNFKILAGRDSLRAGWSGIQTWVEAMLSVPVQTCPETHPASCKMGTGLL